MRNTFCLLVPFLMFVLSYSAFGQSTKSLKKLFEGVDVSKVDEAGNNYLHLAVKKQDVELVEYFAVYHPELLEGRDVDGDTPFLLSCLQEDFKIMKALLRKGADINAFNYLGLTCQHHLIFTGQLPKLNKKIKYLFNNGADWTQKDIDGDSAFLASCLSRNFEIMKFLVEKKGVDVGETNHEENGCLHYLAKRGVDKEGLIDYIIKKGGDPLKENSNGETPGDILMKAHNNDAGAIRDYLHRHFNQMNQNEGNETDIQA